VTEYHTDPDGKRWARIQLLGLGEGGIVYGETAPKDGDRWVLERPEPEMEEWVRLKDIAEKVPETLCWNGNVSSGGGESHKSYWQILQLPKRRLPKSESRQ
jgi:hypothetical protein